MKRELYKWTNDIKNINNNFLFLENYIHKSLLENKENLKRGRVCFDVTYKKYKDKNRPRQRILEKDQIESIEFHGRIEFKTGRK